MKNLRIYHIKFMQGPGFGGAALWESELKRIEGINRAGIDAEKMEVYIEHDPLECSRKELEKWLIKTGFVIEPKAVVLGKDTKGRSSL